MNSGPHTGFNKSSYRRLSVAFDVKFRLNVTPTQDTAPAITSVTRALAKRKILFNWPTAEELDLGRQAADIIEQRSAEAALRESEEAAGVPCL
jgi:hypothetical protein